MSLSDSYDAALSEPGAEDRKLLERLFRYSRLRIDPHLQAGVIHSMLKRFGNISEVIHAPKNELELYVGKQNRFSELIDIIVTANIALNKVYPDKRIDFVNSDRVYGHLFARMAHLDVEQIRILYLNRRDQLIVEEAPWKGTVIHVRIYEREIIRRSLDLGATSLVIAHNHPSGSVKFSKEDIFSTRRLARILDLMQILLRDHILVTRSGCVSFRKKGFFDSANYFGMSNY